MPYVAGSPFNAQSSVQIVTSNLENIVAGMDNVLYPYYVWKNVIPEGSIDTNVNPGALFSSYLVKDRRGAGAFRARGSNNVPTVGATIDKVSVPIEPSGVSTIYDIQDQRQWEMGHGIQIFTEMGEIMAEAQERHIEGTFFYGNEAVNYTGFLNASTIPTATAPLGASGFPEWDTKTPDEIIFDVNLALGTVWSSSKGRFLVSSIGLPLDQINLIIGTKGGDRANDETIYNYIRRNNLYTVTTGNELEIVPIRYLEDAGAAGTARMRVYSNEPSYWKMDMPLPFQMLEPSYQGFQTSVFGEYIFGPPLVKQPLSQFNLDGI